MRSKKFVVVLMILVMCVGVLSACQNIDDNPVDNSTNAEPKTEPIKLGFISCLSTGGASETGIASRNAFELAVNECNEAGGIDGRKIELIIYDDEAKPEKAVELVTRLIEEDKVAGISGFVNSGNALAVTQLVQESEVPMIVNCTATDITMRYKDEPKNYSFRFGLLDAFQVESMLNFVEKEGYNKIGILHDTSGYGVNGMTDITRQMKERGMEADMIETFNTNDTDMTTQLKKFQNSDIDLVYIYGLSPEAANIVRSAEKIGYSPKFIGPISMSFETYQRLAGDLREGTYTATAYIPESNEKSVEIHKTIMDTYGIDALKYGTALGYDTAQLMINALKATSDDITPNNVRDALENLDYYEGVLGRVEKPYSKTDHEAIDASQIFIAKWENGKLVKQ